MRKKIALAVVAASLLVPGGASADNPGSDNASECGAFHGMLGFPAHGALIPFVPNFATSGAYKNGTVGKRQRDPWCHD